MSFLIELVNIPVIWKYFIGNFLKEKNEDSS